MKGILTKLEGISLRYGKASLNLLRIYLFLNIIFVGLMVYVMMIASAIGLGFATMADVTKVPDSSGFSYVVYGGLIFLVVAVYGFLLLTVRSKFFVKYRVRFIESLLIVFVLMFVISLFQLALLDSIFYLLLLLLGIFSYYHVKVSLESSYKSPNKVWLALKVFPLSVFLILCFGMAPYSLSSVLPLKGLSSQAVSEDLNKSTAEIMAKRLHRDAMAYGLFAEGRAEGDSLLREDFVKAFSEQEYLEGNDPIFDADKLTLSYKGIVYYMCLEDVSLERCEPSNRVS